MNILRSIFSILFGKLFLTILSFIFTPVIVRFLGSSGYGNYAFLLAFLGIVMVPVNSGIFDGIRKFISEKDISASRQKDIIGFYLLLGTASTAAIIIISVILLEIGFVRSLIGSELKMYMYLVFGLIVAQQFYSIFRACLMGVDMEKISEPIHVTRKFILIILASVLMYLGYGVSGVLVAHILSNIVATIFELYYIPFKLRISFDLSTYSYLNLKKLVMFNIHSVLLVLLLVSIHNFDILLIRTLLGSAEAGYYKGAFALFSFVWVFSRVFQMSLLHNTSEMWSRGDRGSISRLSGKATRYSVLTSGLLGIGLAGLSGEFIPIYFGDEFLEMKTSLIILIPGIIAFSGVRPLLATCQGKGQIKPLIYVMIISTLFNIFLNLIFIPEYGIEGAAIATSLSYISTFLLFIWIAKSIGFDPINSLLPIRLILSLGLFSLVFKLITLYPLGRFLSLSFFPILGGIIFILICIVFRSIEFDELLQAYDIISETLF